MGTRVVRWERKGNQVLFREVKYDVVADSDAPERPAVDAANNDTIIPAFPVQAEGPDGAAVIGLGLPKLASLSTR